LGVKKKLPWPNKVSLWVGRQFYGLGPKIFCSLFALMFRLLWSSRVGQWLILGVFDKIYGNKTKVFALGKSII
jgi:hypothetical protein